MLKYIANYYNWIIYTVEIEFIDPLNKKWTGSFSRILVHYGFDAR